MAWIGGVALFAAQAFAGPAMTGLERAAAPSAAVAAEGLAFAAVRWADGAPSRPEFSAVAVRTGEPLPTVSASRRAARARPPASPPPLLDLSPHKEEPKLDKGFAYGFNLFQWPADRMARVHVLGPFAVAFAVVMIPPAALAGLATWAFGLEGRSGVDWL